MNQEVVQEKLAAVLAHEPFCELRMSRDKRCQCQHRETSLAALLPVVREIAAEELREAADGLTWDGLLHAADYAGYAAKLVRERAGALETGRGAM
jgi:hypothetical protein